MTSRYSDSNDSRNSRENVGYSQGSAATPYLDLNLSQDKMENIKSPMHLRLEKMIDTL